MLLSKETYRKCIAMLEGKEPPDALLRELITWAWEVLEINIIAFEYAPLLNDLRMRLLVIVKNGKSMEKIYNPDGWSYDEQKQDMVQLKFRELCKKHHEAYVNEGVIIFVAYGNLAEDIKIETLSAVNDVLQTLKTEFCEIPIQYIYTGFTAIYIFYEAEEQIKRYEQSGISAAIQRRCCEIVAKHDKYKIFDGKVCCFFDSYRRLMEEYAGSMYFYLS